MEPAPGNSEHKFYESICPRKIFTPLIVQGRRYILHIFYEDTCPHGIFSPPFCSWGRPRTSLSTNSTNISVYTKSVHRCLLVEPAPNNSEHNSTKVSVHTKSLHRCLLVEPAPNNSKHKFYESICPHEIFTPLFCSWSPPRTTLNTNSTNISVHTKSIHRCFVRGARPEQLCTQILRKYLSTRNLYTAVLFVEPAPKKSEHTFYEHIYQHEIFTPLFCSWGRPRTILNTNYTKVSVHTKS